MTYKRIICGANSDQCKGILYESGPNSVCRRCGAIWTINRINRYRIRYEGDDPDIVTHPTVCSELCRQGYMTEAELEIDYQYAVDRYDYKTILFYRKLAWPLVWSMKHSPRFTKYVVYPIACRCWLNKMLDR